LARHRRPLTISRMPRTRIKICGITRPQDSALAQSVGADAIGMIFHPPARRSISLEAARQIMAQLGPFVTPIGVFVDAPTDRIIQMAGPLGLRIVQLHGHEPPAQVLELRQSGLRAIKALRVDPNLPSELEPWRDLHRRSDALSAIVLDTAATTGGSGVENDWQGIRHFREFGIFHDLPPIVVAGGLSPDNICDVVRGIRPWAVDVSSGVEASYGIKSAELVGSFVEQVRLADELSGT